MCPVFCNIRRIAVITVQCHINSGKNFTWRDVLSGDLCSYSACTACEDKHQTIVRTLNVNRSVEINMVSHNECHPYPRRSSTGLWSAFSSICQRSRTGIVRSAFLVKIIEPSVACFLLLSDTLFVYFLLSLTLRLYSRLLKMCPMFCIIRRIAVITVRCLINSGNNFSWCNVLSSVHFRYSACTACKEKQPMIVLTLDVDRSVEIKMVSHI